MQPKIKLLRVLDILRSTDKTHPITAVGICNLLEREGISAERKSVCRDINTLKEYGYKIILCHDNKKGYYMEEAKKTDTTTSKKVAKDLILISVEYKKEDAEKVYHVLGKGKETFDDDYVTSEIEVESDLVFPALFELGVKVKLLEPTTLKSEFEEKLDELSDFYKKRRSNKRMEVWLL